MSSTVPTCAFDMPVEMQRARNVAVMLAAFSIEHGSIVALSRPMTTGLTSSSTFGARAALCFITRNIKLWTGR